LTGEIPGSGRPDVL